MGIADGASEPGRPGLVDQSQFARANQAIQMACQNLVNPASSQQQVITANQKLRYNNTPLSQPIKIYVTAAC